MSSILLYHKMEILSMSDTKSSVVQLCSSNLSRHTETTEWLVLTQHLSWWINPVHEWFRVGAVCAHNNMGCRSKTPSWDCFFFKKNCLETIDCDCLPIFDGMDFSVDRCVLLFLSPCPLALLLVLCKITTKKLDFFFFFFVKSNLSWSKVPSIRSRGEMIKGLMLNKMFGEEMSSWNLFIQAMLTEHFICIIQYSSVLTTDQK